MTSSEAQTNEQCGRAACYRPQGLANGFHGMARVTTDGEALQPWQWDDGRQTYVRLEEYERLRATLLEISQRIPTDQCIRASDTLTVHLPAWLRTEVQSALEVSK